MPFQPNGQGGFSYVDPSYGSSRQPIIDRQIGGLGAAPESAYGLSTPPSLTASTVSRGGMGGLTDPSAGPAPTPKKKYSKGDRTKAGLTGLATGAATGAALGSTFGPYGTAIGAVAGGLGGLIRGLRRTKN